VRALLFCNEMLGLGHLRLSLVLAGALAGEQGTALVVTGSPAFAGVPVPPGVDLVKIPAAPLTDSSWGATTMRPPAALRVPSERQIDLRSALSLAAAQQFEPDVALVDYRPLGRGDDLRATLEWLRHDGRATVGLGLWEVDDNPVRIADFWSPELVDAVSELYDLALVYGDSVAGDLRIERLRAAGVPVHHTGLVGAPPSRTGPADLDGGYLLATAGGGVDGFPLLSALVDALEARPLGIPAVIVTGPMMLAAQVAALRERAAAAGIAADVRIERQRPDMDALLAGCRAVVSMAGYNTTAEVLGSGKPALLAPRGSPREEQLNRARRLAAAGRVELLEPSALEPGALRAALDRLLARRRTDGDPLTGAADTVRILTAARAQRRASAT
jgi:predicted glycosyltransferase